MPNEISWTDKGRLKFIECDDYSVGKFEPVSFTPILNWQITRSEFIDDRKNTNLSRWIMMKARLNHFTIKVIAGPYSYGIFSAECRSIGYGSEANWLDTNDPEDAIYRTEIQLKRFLRNNADFYIDLLKSLSKLKKL